jgi:signal transduction histidine kinase
MSRPDRWGWRRPHARVGVAVVLSIVEILGALSDARETAYPRELNRASALLLLLGPLALVLRKRYPVPVMVVAFGSALAWVFLGFPPGPFFLAPTVALFSAVRLGHRVPAAVVAGLAYAAYVLGGWPFAASLGVPEVSRLDLRGAIGAAVWLIAVFAFSEAARVRSLQYAEMAKVRAEQARARAEQERRQQSEERLRIARELHDVLGHHLSLINVQAGVGLHLLDSRPEQAREALTAIRSASAEALREVRTVLGVLRPEDEQAPRAPAPGLDGLAELTAEAGLPVTVRRTGEPRPLPAEVDRAAYRIVQEALTNVRRHAGAGVSAEVTVAYEPRLVRVVVTDDGAASSAAADDGGGNGIAGMRARAAALGGTLSAGPADGGGFRVEATLPEGAG